MISHIFYLFTFNFIAVPKAPERNLHLNFRESLETTKYRANDVFLQYENTASSFDSPLNFPLLGRSPIKLRQIYMTAAVDWVVKQ